MKKLLLSASAALLVAGGANAAVKDPNVYDVTNGIKCESVWILDRVHAGDDAWTASEVGKAAGKARTAVTYDGTIYVGSSLHDDPTIVDDKNAPVDCAGVEKYDLETGAYLGKIKVTLDGTRISGLLCANQVGVDNFGNLWIAGYSASNAGTYKVYSVDKATGAAKLEADLPRDLNGRIDYCDLIGDVTRVNARCVVMAAAAQPAESAIVYRWSSEQGSADWDGGWDGDNSLVMAELYPANQTIWSYAPTVTIVEDEGFLGELYYVDGFTTTPSLYNEIGALSDSFANALPLAPSAGTNGVAEFSLLGKDFLVYSIEQHTGSLGGQNFNICELGEGMQFTGMSKYWTLPADGMGMISDGGNRVESLGREYITDEAGKEGVLISAYKNVNGMAVYLVADKDFKLGSGGVSDATIATAKISVKGNVIVVSEEASEIAVFNTAGQLVAKANNATEIVAPTAGAYIVKATVAGSNVVSKVIL